MDSFEDLKSQGNSAFKQGAYEKSLISYNEALDVATKDTEKVIIYKNKAAVYLKLKEYENAVEAATKALEITPDDPKALYRRSEALENLNRYQEAYRDATKALSIDPGNKSLQPILSRLYIKVQENIRLNSEIDVKISKMVNIVFNPLENLDNRETAFKNIFVLTVDKSSAEAVYKFGIVPKIASLLKTEKDKQNLYVTGVRIICELCKGNVDRTKEIINFLGIPWVFETMNHRDESLVNCGRHFFQTILNTFSGLTNKSDSKPDQQLCDDNRKEIDVMLSCLVCASNNRSISGLSRDCILQLITRNVHYTAINWAETLIKLKGLQKILEIASEMPEFKYESAIEITESTKAITAVCLERIYENMYYDEARKIYLDNVDDFVKEKLLAPDIESKIRVTVALTVLLQGPIDVGNAIISRPGILEMILTMAGTDDLIQQKVACECIVAAAAKQSKVIAVNGVEVLRKLCLSENDSIRIRALVGLCKVGSSGGSDASAKPFTDGSNEKFAKICIKYLTHSNEADIRHWAVEGLSYLTLDAQVKEMLINNDEALKALIEIGKKGNTMQVYAVVATFVNLCNAYEKQEIIPEMIELAKFAKRHVPEEHEYDGNEYVDRRILKLGQMGITAALVALAKTESHNCKELISRIFNSLCGIEELRGFIIQQGGAKCLLSLCSEGTANGIKQAAQALARLAITMDPKVAFPGERFIELIKPLLALLLPECSALMNFEALLALCNIAGISEQTRTHILKERGLSKIESYLYEEHEMLRRAATQCFTNLVQSPEIVKIFEGENDKFKLMYLLCGEEDTETCKAAAGAVATITYDSKICCNTIFSVKDWIDVLKQILAHPDTDVQHRALVIVSNILSSGQENADKLLNTEILEILMALSILPPEDNKQKIITMAKNCLEEAEKLKIIKKTNLE